MIIRVDVDKDELELISQALGNEYFGCGYGKEVSPEIICAFLGRGFDFVECDLFQVAFNVF